MHYPKNWPTKVLRHDRPYVQPGQKMRFGPSEETDDGLSDFGKWLMPKVMAGIARAQHLLYQLLGKETRS